MRSIFSRRRDAARAVPDGWLLPHATGEPGRGRVTRLGPLGGGAEAQIDARGAVRPSTVSWTLDWWVHGSDGWVAAATAPKVSQKLVGDAVVETTMVLPIGHIVHRTVVGVVGGVPSAIVEVENKAGVAVALAFAVRPFVPAPGGSPADAAGVVNGLSFDADVISVDGVAAIRTERAPVVCVASADADLWAAPPDPNSRGSITTADSSAGLANGVGVWPVAHTTSLRVAVALEGDVPAGASVPTPDDVARGWDVHLGQGLAVEVGDTAVTDAVRRAQRMLLTLDPDDEATEAALVVVALAESGFAEAGNDWLPLLDPKAHSAHSVLQAFARWQQLGGSLNLVEEYLEPIAIAAHRVHKSGRLPAWGPWAPSALGSLAAALQAIDQPDVADRILDLHVDDRPDLSSGDRLVELAESVRAMSPTGTWGSGSRHDQLFNSAHVVIDARSLLVADAGPAVALLPEVPVPWRGRAIEAHRIRVEGGLLSFGIRWHGRRPALFWELDASPDTPFELRVPGVSSEWVSTELSGEDLLPDPGWPAGGADDA